jgi:hypothetical protein
LIGYEYRIDLESLDIWPFCIISIIFTSPISICESQWTTTNASSEK